MSNNFAPLGWSLGVLLFIGFVFPFVLEFFITPQDVTYNSVTAGLYGVIDDGVVIDIPIIGDFNFNPFFILGTSAKAHLLNTITYMSLLPTFVTIILIIFLPVAIIYSIIKLLPG